MIIVKATKESETGARPSPETLTCMGRFNEELVKAGVMVDAAGLKASKYGARVKCSSGKKPTVVDGPFTEAKELVAGYWIWQCKSLEEAIEWVKRRPNPPPDAEASEIEIRPFFELSDIPEVLDQVRAIQERSVASKK